jgi:hypothetical protein
MVLPEPVRDPPIQSLPASIGGIQDCWIGVGFVIDKEARVWLSQGATDNDANVSSVVASAEAVTCFSARDVPDPPAACILEIRVGATTEDNGSEVSPTASAGPVTLSSPDEVEVDRDLTFPTGSLETLRSFTFALSSESLPFVSEVESRRLLAEGSEKSTSRALGGIVDVGSGAPCRFWL